MPFRDDNGDIRRKSKFAVKFSKDAHQTVLSGSQKKHIKQYFQVLERSTSNSIVGFSIGCILFL